jgi:hypothetical protein
VLIGYCNVLFCGSLQSFCCVDISRRYFTSFSVVVLPQIQDNYCICRQLSERSSHILSDCSLTLHHLPGSTQSSSRVAHHRLDLVSPKDFHHCFRCFDLPSTRPLKYSSHILSDFSLALYPPEFTSLSLANGRLLPSQIYSIFLCHTILFKNRLHI